MNMVDKIKKRIETLEFAKNEKIKEVEVTKEEAEQIPEKIKGINGVRLIIVDELGDRSKKDCFAYKDKKCCALNELYCKKESCNFYRNDIKMSDIESSVRRYNKPV